MRRPDRSWALGRLQGVAPSTTGDEALDERLGFGSALTAHPHILLDPTGGPDSRMASALAHTLPLAALSCC